MNTMIINPVEQVQASPKMKQSYGFTSSKDILMSFADHGWHPVSTQYGKSVRQDKQGYQKHLVKLENDKYSSIDGLSNNNNSKPQLVLLNSHDGSSSLQLFWGLIRMACLNGIISGNAVSSFRLIHSQSITKRLPDAIEYMLSNFNTFTDQIKTLQSLKFSNAAENEFIQSVYNARLSNVGKLLAVDYNLPGLLRQEDNGQDAYTIFNRVQEVLIKGGIQYSAERNRLDSQGRVIEKYVVDTRTRRLSSVPQQVKLNQFVYDKALALAN